MSSVERLLPLLGAAVCALVLPACLTHGYYVSGTEPMEEASYREWRHHLLYGLVDLGSDIDLRAACPQGVARVENEIAPANVLFHILTLSIYAPTTTWVYCQQPAETTTPEPAAEPPPPEPAPPTAAPGEPAEAAGPPDAGGGEIPVVDHGAGDVPVVEDPVEP